MSHTPSAAARVYLESPSSQPPLLVTWEAAQAALAHLQEALKTGQLAPAVEKALLLLLATATEEQARQLVVRAVLTRCEGHTIRAAAQLGISRKTLYTYMDRGVKVPLPRERGPAPTREPPQSMPLGQRIESLLRHQPGYHEARTLATRLGEPLAAVLAALAELAQRGLVAHRDGSVGDEWRLL